VAHTKFSDEELKKRLFFEIIMVERWHERNGKPMPLSQYLYMLAGMFSEIEARSDPKPSPDNPHDQSPCARLNAAL
jgi:hypothetical protein